MAKKKSSQWSQWRDDLLTVWVVWGLVFWIATWGFGIYSCFAHRAPASGTIGLVFFATGIFAIAFAGWDHYKIAKVRSRALRV